MSDPRPIGIFDSGVGGLTVVDEIRKLLPQEDVVYFGDTARVPYGTKSKATVTRFSVENVEFLMKHNVKLVVVACNTASSLSLAFLKRCFRVPVIGVIGPGARCAVKSTRNKRVGVIGTRATIASGAYDKAIKKIKPGITSFGEACALFVPLVEEGWLDGDVTYKTAMRYLAPLKEKRIDTLILGCTHYPLLKDVIKKIVGRSVLLVDSAKEVALETKGMLESGGILNSPGRKGIYKFFVSDEPGRFIEMGRRFLKRRIDCVKRAG